MIRHAMAVVAAMSMSPAPLYAQGSVFTVRAASADVYQAPSTGSPVVGHAPRGSVLPVTRELGSWVKVSWPRAQDGVGYVHVSTGSLGRKLASEPNEPSAPRPPNQTPEPASSTPLAIRVERPVPVAQPAPSRVVYVKPSTHLVGVGGGFGSSSVGVGASVRAWHRNRFGAQIEMSRAAVVGVAPTERVSSMQFAPSALYSLPDHVADYMWLRPYIGSGINISHHSLSTTTPGAGPVSEDALGLQVFGGSELTLAAVPRFALSVDVGYRWRGTSFAGVDFGGIGLSVAGRWYVK